MQWYPCPRGDIYGCLFTLILLPLALTVFAVIPTEWLRVVLRHGADHNESDAQVSVMRQWKQTLFCASSAPQDSKHLKPMLFSVAGVWPKSELKSSQDTSTSVAATRSVNRKGEKKLYTVFMDIFICGSLSMIFSFFFKHFSPIASLAPFRGELILT